MREHLGNSARKRLADQPLPGLKGMDAVATQQEVIDRLPESTLSLVAISWASCS